MHTRRVTSCFSLQPLCYFLVAAALLISSASALENDSTGDGLDELICAELDNKGNVDWTVLSSDSGFSEEIATSSNLGENGDHLTPGRWLDENVLLGYATLTRKNKKSWKVESEAGVVSKLLGSRKSLLISGADFDGDGITDPAILSRKGVLTSLLGGFLSDNPGQVRLRVPRKGGRAAVSNQGKGAAAFVRIGDSDQGVVAWKKKGRVQLARTDGIKLRLPGRFKGKISSLNPMVRPDGSVALLIVESKGNNVKRIRVFDLGGGELYDNQFQTNGTLVIGRFTSSSVGEQFAIQLSDSLVAVSVFGDGSSSDLSVDCPIPVDLINVNSFRSSGSGGSSGGGGSDDSGGGSNDGGGSSPSGGLASVCSEVFEFTTGRLWKPKSDVNDNRGGKPVMLLTGSNKAGLDGKTVWDSDGNVVCDQMTYKQGDDPNINKGADHFYSGWIGGCDLTPDQMASIARGNTGSVNVFVEWKGSTCLRVGDPRVRKGGI